MSIKYMTGKECINVFKEIGVNMTEPNFSKYKKKGTFTIYKIDGKKRDMFILDEVLTEYFRVNIPKNIADEEARKNYYMYRDEKKKEKILIENIEKQWSILTKHQNIYIDFKIFDISNMWISAAKELEELKECELKGKTIDDEVKAAITKTASTSKDEHLEAFREDIDIYNAQNQTLCDVAIALCKGLGKKHTGFHNNSLEHDIYEIMAKMIITPENVVSYYDEYPIFIIKE